MVIAYVESNFLLEIAFGQAEADACERLLELAEQRRIEVAVPAFALVEPQWTLRKNKSDRAQRQRDLRMTLKQVKENTLFRALGEPVEKELEALFFICDQEETQQLRRVCDRLLSVAVVLPLTSAVVIEAGRLADDLGFERLDAIMLSSVLDDRSRSQTKGFFINRNVKDFGTDDVVNALAARQCEFVGSFRGGLARIRAELRM